ncbi:MAG: hypothetical protein WBX11_06625 [Thiobacillaceae bacterium]
MDKFALERAFAYEHLGRWIDRFRADYLTNPEVADLMLGTALVVTKDGEARFATAKELAAANVLYQIGCIEAMIETGEAKILVDGAPMLTLLHDELDQHLTTLAGLTGNEQFARRSTTYSSEGTESGSVPARREQQIEIILAVIAALEFDPMEIPDGGKATIRKACLTRPRIFTSDAFDHAWKFGLKAEHFRLANSEKYSSKP